jgi:hypothetical protein
MTPRELRVWHWRRAMSARAAANGYPGQSPYAQHRAKSNHRLADFHIGCVQVCNEFPECRATTAEQDDLTMPKPHSRRPKWRTT